MKDGLTRFPLFGVKFDLVLLLPCYRFVDYVSTICEDAAQGKELLTTTINDLFSVPVSGNSEEDSEDHQSANTVVKVKPTLHWSTVYIQEQTVACVLLLSFFYLLNHRIFTLATNYSIHLFLTFFPFVSMSFFFFPGLIYALNSPADRPYFCLVFRVYLMVLFQPLCLTEIFNTTIL